MAHKPSIAQVMMVVEKGSAKDGSDREEGHATK